MKLDLYRKDQIGADKLKQYDAKITTSEHKLTKFNIKQTGN